MSVSGGSGLDWVFSGIGSGAFVGIAAWVKARIDQRAKVKAQNEDKAHAEDLGVRDMVVTMYNAFITPKATIFNRNPAPGLLDRVQSIDERLMDHDKRLNDLASSIERVAHNAAAEVQEQTIERERVRARDA